MGGGRFRSKGRMAGALCFALSLLALLLWGKLKLVTGAPRTAYAHPGARPSARNPAGLPAQERTSQDRTPR